MDFADLVGRYVINAPDVVTEDFDGQVVVLNLANGHYFQLEGIAGKIWDTVLHGLPLDQVVASAQAARPELATDVVSFLRQLVNLRLIKPDEGPGSSVDAHAADWAGDPPRLIVYEDLAELIYADPIHDVDEQAGWPAPRAAE